MRRAFYMFNVNGDGQLTADQLASILSQKTSSGEPLTAEEIQEIFADFDEDNSGTLDIEEFLRAMVKLQVRQSADSGAGIVPNTMPLNASPLVRRPGGRSPFKYRARSAASSTMTLPAAHLKAMDGDKSPGDGSGSGVGRAGWLQGVTETFRQFLSPKSDENEGSTSSLEGSTSSLHTSGAAPAEHAPQSTEQQRVLVCTTDPGSFVVTAPQQQCLYPLCPHSFIHLAFHTLAFIGLPRLGFATHAQRTPFRLMITGSFCVSAPPAHWLIADVTPSIKCILGQPEYKPIAITLSEHKPFTIALHSFDPAGRHYGIIA